MHPLHLPQTTFTKNTHNARGEYHKELESERGRILKQPYRTSQLVTPQPKIKPWEVNIKAQQKPGRRVANSFMSGAPVEDKNILQSLPNQQALIQRQQYNNPKNLYSKENVKEAIFVQTGVQMDPQDNYNYGRAPLSPSYRPPASPGALGQPIHLNPSHLPALNMEHSPTYHYLLELEGPGILKEGVRSHEYEQQQRQAQMMHQQQVQAQQMQQQQHGQQIKMQIAAQAQPKMMHQRPRPQPPMMQQQQMPLNNQQQYQTYGFPSQQNQEIAQSSSFKRLERLVLMDY